MSECQTKAGNQECYWKHEKLSICHSLNLLNNFCFHVSKVTPTRSLSHSLTLALSHSFTLSFTHSRYGEQLLFSCLCSKVTVYIHINVHAFFGTSTNTTPLTLDRVHRAGSQLKKNLCGQNLLKLHEDYSVHSNLLMPDEIGFYHAT